MAAADCSALQLIAGSALTVRLMKKIKQDDIAALTMEGSLRSSLG